MKEFKDICAKMEELTQKGKMTELESRIIVELSKKVVDNIAKKYQKITEGVNRIMGGKVIETEAKKMYNLGIKIGEANGAEREARGEARDRNESLKDQIKKKLAKGKDIPQIAEEIEETEEKVYELLKEIEAEG